MGSVKLYKLRTFQKIRLYLTGKSLNYLLKHPSWALKNIKPIFCSHYDYLKFVSILTNVPVSYCQALMPSGESRRKLITAFRNSIAPSAGEMPVGFEEALSLYLIVRILRPKYVTETGVAAGRSSAFILCALHDNDKGELYSMDPDPNSGYAIPRELKYRWNFINATSEEVLPGLLRSLKQIDIFLHDSLHTYNCMLFEYNTAWPFIKDILLSDDVSWNSSFRDFCKDIAGKVVYLHENFAGIRKC